MSGAGNLEEGNPFERDCGACTMCCTSLHIRALNKPRWTVCPHQCSAGCAIYQSPERPTECREWKCLWKEGFFDETWRPDRLGVFWQITGEDNPFNRTLFVAHSDHDEGFVSARDAILLVSSKHRVLVVERGENKVAYLGPNEQMALINAVLKRKTKKRANKR